MKPTATSHEWLTDREMGYAQFDREWCINCGRVRNTTNEAIDCTGRCSVTIQNKRAGASRNCRYAAVEVIEGQPVCRAHAHLHHARAKKKEVLQRELEKLTASTKRSIS